MDAYDLLTTNVPVAIAVDNVTVQRSARAVLRGVSFAVPRGQITVIVGPSGVGKTTLVGALNGLLRPVAGRISVAGVGCLDEPRALLEHRRRTATVFQDYALLSRSTALDNVLLGLLGARLSPGRLLFPWPFSGDERRAALGALEQVGLAHRALSRVAHLSGGERQRVGVARALVRRPTLVLGDEPFAAMDPSFVQYLSDEFRRLVESTRLTVVLILHHIEVARALADRLIGLSSGSVAFDGPPTSFDAAAYRAVFGAPRDRLRVAPSEDTSCRG